MQDLDEEFRDDGLVVMALSDEESGTVGDYVDQLGITVKVAAGSNAGSSYGVSGIPAAVLIDPEGNVAWRGHPSSLSKGTVKSALKGARKPSSGGFLSVRPTFAIEDAGALENALEAADEGKLAKALEAAQALSKDEAAEQSDRDNAELFAMEIESHLSLLATQAESFVSRRDVLPALEVFEALAKEMKGHEAGDAAAKRLAEIAEDDELQAEIEAAEAFVKVKKKASKLSSRKALGLYEDFAEKYAGTRMAERARMMAVGLK